MGGIGGDGMARWVGLGVSLRASSVLLLFRWRWRWWWNMPVL